MGAIVQFLIKYFVDSVYCIGYRQAGDFWGESLSKFHVLKPTLHYWYADPIPIEKDGKIYVFVEKYDRFKNRGYIGLSVLKSNGRLSRPRTILKEDTHLSFPNVIFYKNQYYMLPEASETKRIEFYRMKDSFYNWEHYYSLDIGEEIVDIDYYILDDKILLIGGVLKDNAPMYVKNQIICLENLDNIESLNYSISYTDAQFSLKKRNGGNFYKKNGHMYRILQESTEEIYGKSLILSRVLHLNHGEIKEKEVKRKEVSNIKVSLLGCFYKKIGIHTYGCCEGGFEVIDISAAKISILPFIRYLKSVRSKNKL